ncbi:hypothetical protein, partial [Escherichia coli]|uniref:hypothetical protein n=1 Tax=Escherichia coli TaxID=562 RepID=UPI001BD28241
LRAFQARPNSPPALCRREYPLEVKMDHKNAAGERLQLAKEPKPWISPQECNMLTATEGVAVVVLNRAGAPRRDAIELVPEYRAG